MSVHDSLDTYPAKPKRSEISVGLLRGRLSLRPALFLVVSLVIAAVSIAPVAYLFSASLMQPSQIFSVPLQLVPHPPRLQNFVDIFVHYNIGHYLFNSSIVAFCVVSLNLLFCSLTGYSLAKFRYPGRELIFVFILATMMVPFNVIVVPLYTVVRSLGWIDTLQALIVPGMMTAFGVFLMRQFIGDIPDEYLDAARIDGAYEFTIYWRIIIPLTKPALATLAVLILVDNWDSLLWPLIVLSSDTWKTIPLGLTQFLSIYGNQWSLLMAAAVVATGPLLIAFFVLQRYFQQGLSALSGIKG